MVADKVRWYPRVGLKDIIKEGTGGTDQKRSGRVKRVFSVLLERNLEFCKKCN